MKRAYTFLSLLIIIGVMRPPALAQQPSTQSPTILRQSFMAETLRRRSAPPEIEEPILRIETFVFLPPDPNRGLGQPNPLLKDLSSLYDTALFQRQRFRETGQPIEYERRNLYFRQDRHVSTKGIVLFRFCNDRIDLGVYKRNFHNEAAPQRGQPLWYRQPGRIDRPNDERQYFFGMRFKLGKPNLQKNQ
jgi:hypothetical protein